MTNAMTNAEPRRFWQGLVRALCMLALLVAPWGWAGCSDDGDAEMLPTISDVDFDTEVQPIFTAGCALSQCHDDSSPTGAMDLSEGNAFGSTVSTPASSTYPGETRVVPGDTSESLLYQKLIGNSFGAKMPLPPGTITERQIQTIRVWIEEGAKGNPIQNVSFATDVEPIFMNCTFSPCHDDASPAGGMDLTGSAYDNIVGVAASNVYPGEIRVVARDTAASLLYQKLLGNSNFGSQMPLPPGSISQRQRDTIKVWIQEGAQDN